MNSENSKTFKPYVLILNVTDKIDLRRGEKNIALSNLIIYYRKSSYNNSNFKIFASTWNDDFKLSDGSYSISDIQDYFEYILQKHGENIDNASVRIYINKKENRIRFEIKTECYLELLTLETMKLLGSSENKLTKHKNGENVPHLEITEVVLVHCNIVSNDYQQDSRLSYTLFLINHLLVY